MKRGHERVISHVDQPEVAHAILEHLGMPSTAPVAARARDPTDDEDARGDTMGW
jgi:hypothetical protein